MIFNEETALQTAEFLLQVKAVKLSPEKPFTWASGIISPIYCDNRVTLSFPSIRTFIRQRFVSAINEYYGEVDAVAGVATGAIAQGVLVAQEMGLPFAYVRASKKDHGMTNRVEGRIEKGQSVVVVEDLISTGGSSLSAVEALREAGCNVKGMVSIFTYDLDKARNNFEKANCQLVSLCDYHMLIRKAVEDGYIQEQDLEALIAWRENPEKWGK
jgi:orotate phosphoribosyltransferase